jgi:energy-coupling factor transporter ATP-binding protein EcfA2
MKDTLNTSAPVIVVQGLNLVFQTGDGPVHALKDVNLSINRGEFVSFIGLSGCGKTTFLRAIAALRPAAISRGREGVGSDGFGFFFSAFVFGVIFFCVVFIVLSVIFVFILVVFVEVIFFVSIVFVVVLVFVVSIVAEGKKGARVKRQAGGQGSVNFDHQAERGEDRVVKENWLSGGKTGEGHHSRAPVAEGMMGRVVGCVLAVLCYGDMTIRWGARAARGMA